MNIRSIFTIIASLSTGLIACDRPECKNQNPIFESNAPDSKVYKDELVDELASKDPSELSYWLQRYEESNGEESLYFNVQGDGLCAILHLNVNDWTKLEEVRERKGVGRSGAEFTNLRYQINQDSMSTEFVYQTFDKIID